MKRINVWFVLSLMFLITGSVLDSTILSLTILFVSIGVFRYVNTCIHELGHFVGAKLVGFEVVEVVIGEMLEKQVLQFNLFGTPFRLNFGAGGVAEVNIKAEHIVKWRLLLFVLGGIILQLIICVTMFIIFRFGDENSYYLPLIFGLMNVWSMIRSVVPRLYLFNGIPYQRWNESSSNS